MNLHFSKEELRDFVPNAKREWALTNGIGGYAGGCVLGSLGRTHQGYLIASLHPPVERYLVFSKTNERLCVGETIYNLEASQHAGPIYTQGQQYLESFDYDGDVHFRYIAGAITMTKHLTMVQGENKVAIAYDIRNDGPEATLVITPLMNYREHNASNTRKELCFHNLPLSESCGFVLIPQSQPDISIVLTASDGVLCSSEQLYDEDLQFATEVENEVPGLDTCYTPYEIRVTIPADSTKHLSLICYVDTDSAVINVPDLITPIDDNLAFELLENHQSFVRELLETADCKDEFSEILTVAANQFLSYRESTGLTTVLAGLPWFTDWGRDTMIAFTGLTLSTHRFDKAGEILKTFAMYVSHGMVPNMFPDDGQEPLYNTVDASLWYFYAVDQYLRYDNSPEAYAFVEKEIYPALTEIINAYKTGTLFSIYMDTDGLIHAGSGLDQVTWMDVRVGDWVATPRHGKPVEINALWYNALCVMDKLATRFHATDSFAEESPADKKAYTYKELAQMVYKSFNEKFWNPADGCLYDVIDDTDTGCIKDASIRPNQIYTVSLPYTMLDEAKSKSVVDVVHNKLFVGMALRSLDPAHKDYHPIYVGALAKRDAAYHQGTAWGFLLGGFLTAYAKVYGHSTETAHQLWDMIVPVRAHLRDNCVGSICEIFDGNAPHNGRGCYAQAWSVGEILRAYREDILPFL